MKIGHYMPGFWDPGGIAVYLRRIAVAQREAGHEVYFLDSIDRYVGYPEAEFRTELVDSGNLAKRGRELGLDVIHLHSATEPMPRDGPAIVRTLHDHRPYCPSGERYLKRTGQACDRVYDPIGCFWGHMIDRCGTIRPQGILSNFAKTRLEARTLRGITLIAISAYVKEQMLRSGYDAQRIHVLPNPAPATREFSPPPKGETPRLAFLSRLAVHKGLQWLVRCLPKLERPFALDVAGDGPQRAEMERLVARLGLQDRVVFHGWVNEAKVDELVSRARAVVFPAVWHEPAGLVTFDASSRGRAVIASSTGGIPEYAMNERNALLVNPQDDEALIAALRRLIDDWELAKRLGETGYQLAQSEFSLSRHVADLDQIYRGLPVHSCDRSAPSAAAATRPVHES